MSCRWIRIQTVRRRSKSLPSCAFVAWLSLVFQRVIEVIGQSIEKTKIKQLDSPRMGGLLDACLYWIALRVYNAVPARDSGPNRLGANWIPVAEARAEKAIMDISTYLGMTTRTESNRDSEEQTTAAASSTANGNMAAALANVETVEGIFSAIEAFISEDLVKQVKGVFCFDVKGEPEPFYVDLKNGSGSCGKGKPPKGNPDVTLSMDKTTFMQMFTGKLNPTNAFMGGKLSLKGDLPVAMKLDRLMGQMRSKL